jgi:hypothetical protein
VYGVPGTLANYWKLVGTWNVYSTCRDCFSPFHNFSKKEIPFRNEEDIQQENINNHLIVQHHQEERVMETENNVILEGKENKVSSSGIYCTKDFYSYY